VAPGQWTRVAIRLSKGSENKLQLSTFVNGRLCHEDELHDSDFFSVKKEGFLIFSSSLPEEIPGGVHLRYVDFQVSE